MICKKRAVWVPAILALSSLGFGQSFSLTNLDGLGDAGTVARGVNNNGEVIASVTTSGGNQDIATYLNGTFTDQGSPNGNYAIATAINNSGLIVGYYNVVSSDYVPFYLSGGSYTTMTVPGGGVNDRNQAVNNNGFIVGTTDQSNGVEVPYGYNPTNGNYTYYHGSGTTNAYGFGVNDSGNLAGNIVENAQNVGGYYNAGATNPSWTSIGILSGGISSSADAINSSNEVVGTSTINQNNTEAVSYINGVLTGLGSIVGYANSEGVAISDSGTIVGTLNGGSVQNPNGAFYYTSSGKMINLQSLLDASGAGYMLQGVEGISNNGDYIAANAEYVGNGKTYGVLLSLNPVPEPPTMLFSLAFPVAFLYFKRRSR